MGPARRSETARRAFADGDAYHDGHLYAGWTGASAVQKGRGQLVAWHRVLIDASFNSTHADHCRAKPSMAACHVSRTGQRACADLGAVLPIPYDYVPI